MAKTTTCSFCGKEIVKGIFKGDAELLQVTSADFIDCCPECYERYRMDAKASRERFETKLDNYKWQTKKRVDKAQLVSLFLQYVAESKAYTDRLGNVAIGGTDFYAYDEQGHFACTERRMDFGGNDVSAKDKVKALDKYAVIDPPVFTKDDISCIRYRLSNSNTLGLFAMAYSVDICLNTTADVTYRPTYIRSVVLVKGICGYKKKAHRQALELLDTFRQRIGSTLPIEEVRKFR